MQEITKITNNTIRIGNLRFTPFNRLSLEDVYASDLKSDTLLYAEKLYADFDLIKIFRKRFVIHSIEIDNFALNISQDSINAPFNFQFLIEAFSSDSKLPSDSSSLQLAIEKIRLKEGRLRYDILSEPFKTPGIFDFNHADIRNFQLDARVRFENIDNWRSSIENLSFNEKSGFLLSQIKFRIKNSDKKIQVDNLHVLLPNSEAKIQEAGITYKDLEFSEILSGASYSVILSSVNLFLDDFRCFYPDLENFSEEISFSGEIKGKFPEISLPRLELNYGEKLQTTLIATVADYNSLETSKFELNIEKCIIDSELFRLPYNTDFLSFTGNIAGSLQNLRVDIKVKSKQGDLTLNGTGRYILPEENIHFDLNMSWADYNVKNLLSDSAFGKVSFQLATNGTISGFDKIDVKADLDISHFDYLGYTYRNIKANATYIDNNVSLNLSSKDKNLPMNLTLVAGLNKNNYFAKFYGNLNGIHPAAINILPEYPDSELSCIFNADIKGFDPESMTANIVIDNLKWITSSGEFGNSPVIISYLADSNRQKQLNCRSPMINIRGKGNFSFDGIVQSVVQTFPAFFSSNNTYSKRINKERDNFDFLIGIRQANTLARLLGMETTIPDSALFIGKYYSDRDELNMNITAFCIFRQTDTAQVSLNLSNIQNDLFVKLDLKNRSALYDFEGNLGATVNFITKDKEATPDVNIALDPGLLSLNGASFIVYPSQIAVSNKRCEINNFALRHSTMSFLKVNGVISDHSGDSLQVELNRFEIGTILSALKNNFPLSGSASGDITLSRLTTNPLIVTRNFAINDLEFDGNYLGNLQLRSGWSSERQGLALRATWNPSDDRESVISGFYLPARDSLALSADIQGIKMKWLSGYFPETFYGFGGELGMKIRANGKLADPLFSGSLHLNETSFGIKPFNVVYRISDSVIIEKDQIIFQNCIVYDENKRNAKINGSIGHKYFSNLNPKLSLDFNRFLVLNNSEQTDSLFFGLLHINGNLSLQLQNKDWLLQGRLSNGTANKIMINMPEEAIEADRYNWLTFVDKQLNDSVAVSKDNQVVAQTDFSLPLRMQITLSIDKNLSLGTIINPGTKDAAIVNGHGILDLSYSLTNPVPKLFGNYTVDEGKCSLSLKNITKKTFSIRPGGRLNFQGDIANTTFDLSAFYSLRTYLTTLDPGFAAIATSSRIPVNCVLTATGRLENMRLKYRIELPNQTDEVQRKLDGLLYTDDLLIKEMAYLLAFGSFSPVYANSMNTSNSNFWTSLASSSITSQLNNLLSGVLSNNWSIGTDLHSSDANFSDIDMDINISTRLFNDRLTLNSTLGYHNTSTQISNFTGDFDLEYKLTPNGNLLLQFYNVTNNQYYNKTKSPLTQGVAFVYKKEGRVFKQLFK